MKRPGRRSIPLLGWGEKIWKKEVQTHISDDTVRDLHKAVCPQVDSEGLELQPRRKDMADLAPDLDRVATLALHQDRTKLVSKEHKHLVDTKMKENPLDKAILESILAGSIRGNERLSKSHKIAAACRCGAPKEDTAHSCHQRQVS